MDIAKLLAALSDFAMLQQWQYIYPVWSRRAQGLSIGINLHPNHACQWQCIYCQVTALHRGPSPKIDIPKLRHELHACLRWLHDYAKNTGGSVHALLSDIAFAGSGEPTSSPQFYDAIEVVATLLANDATCDKPQFVRVITNGSQLYRNQVQQALMQLSRLNGEVWFKLDAGTDAEMHAINQIQLPVKLHLQRLKKSSEYCKTWVQTAVVARKTANGIITTPALQPYIELLEQVKNDITGILLYGIARASQQPQSKSLVKVSPMLLQGYAIALSNAGYQVRVFD